MATLNLLEFVDIAIRDEETGVAFYKALAEVVKDSRVKEGLLAIAQQEEAQVKWFQKMREEVDQYYPRSMDYYPKEEYPGQYREYFDSLMASREFTDPPAAVAAARAIASDASAIQVAMLLEKDSLLYFKEMRNFVEHSRSASIDVIIEEEREHLVALGKLRRMLG